MARLILQYEGRTQVKGIVDYWERVGKFMLVSGLSCTGIKTIEQLGDGKNSCKFEELAKPILLCSVFQAYIWIGIGLGLGNLAIKYLGDKKIALVM